MKRDKPTVTVTARAYGDAEINVISVVMSALATLDVEARRRVVEYVDARVSAIE
jgi:hypothetical protein